MTIARRDKDGKARSRYSDLELYKAVREVAEFVDAADPERISQSSFDKARASVGHNYLPSARAICMRLADNGDGSLPWREALRRAFDGGIDRARSHARRRGAVEAPHLDQDHLFFALNLVARELGQPPTQDHYSRKRDTLIAKGRRRGSDLIADLMPTAGQLVRIADQVRTEDSSWHDVLELAGLKPASPAATNRQPSLHVPLAEAVDEFVTWNASWPSRDRLREFAKALEVRLEYDEPKRPWIDVIAEARERREVRGDACPNGAAPVRHGRRRPPEIKLPPKPPEHWPLRSDPKHSREACQEAVDSYLESLPKGRQPTKKGYMAYAAEHGLPSHSSLDRWGGFRSLVSQRASEA